MSRPIPILVNSRAGALQVTAGVQQLRKMAEEAGLAAEVLTAASPREMTETVRRLIAEKVERIAVAGGDGTIHLVVQELAHTDTILGILQQGTFNNFATALRLPQDLPSALRVLKDGQPLAVSVGKAGGRYFTEAAGVGLFADGIAIYGNESNKNIWRAGKALLSVFAGFRPHRMRITIDGRTIEERAAMLTVANTYRMAQAVPIAPNAKLTDDHFDVILIGELSRKEVISYYRAVRAQAHLSLPKVKTMEARKIRVETRRPMHVHVDDVDIGTTPVEIEIHPRALKVLVDRI